MPDSPAIASGSRRPLVAGLACLAVAAGLGMWWFRLHSMRAGPGAETWAKGWRDNETEFLALGCAWAASGVFAVVSGILGLWSLGAWKRGRAGWIGPARVAGLDTSGPPPLRGFWTLLGIILVVACALRLPRMSLSFYNDESHNYVRLIGGDWKTFSETEKKFRTPPWSDTAFRNTSGNNGFFYSLLARCCLETWRAVSHAPTGVVREWPLRVPSLLAGLATVAGVALVLKRVGRPTAGLVASLLLAIHPWHVRYSTEARGYGLMMACLVFGLYFLVRAWRSGRWGDWLGQGLCQFGLLWAYPGALYAVALGQVVVGIALAARWRSEKHVPVRENIPAVHLVRWAGGGLVAVMLACFLLLPGVIQLGHELKTNPSLVRPPGEELGLSWWQDTGSLLAVGAGWDEIRPNPPFLREANFDRWLRVAALCATAVAVGWGARRAGGRRPTRLLAAVALAQIASLVVLFGSASRGGNVLLPWYGLPALPGVVLLAACCLPLVEISRQSKGAVALLCLAALGISTVLPRVAATGKADPRALVRLARGGDFPDQDPRPVTLAFWSDAPTYDPRMKPIASVEDLEIEIEAARRDNRPLFVFTAHEERARRNCPGLVARLKNGGEFHLVAMKSGLESFDHANYLYELNSVRPDNSSPVP